MKYFYIVEDNKNGEETELKEWKRLTGGAYRDFIELIWEKRMCLAPQCIQLPDGTGHQK